MKIKIKEKIKRKFKVLRMKNLVILMKQHSKMSQRIKKTEVVKRKILVISKKLLNRMILKI